MMRMRGRWNRIGVPQKEQKKEPGHEKEREKQRTPNGSFLLLEMHEVPAHEAHLESGNEETDDDVNPHAFHSDDSKNRLEGRMSREVHVRQTHGDEREDEQ